MSSLFSRGADWLSAALKVSGATRTITVKNKIAGATITITVQATPGTSDWEESGIESVTRVASQDFMVDVADMVSGGNRTLPQRGWIVVDSLDGATYEVFAPDGQAPWNWCDMSQRRVRIHTQALDRAQ